MARGDLIRRSGGTSISPISQLDPLRRLRELFAWDPFQEMEQLLPTGAQGVAFMPAFEVKETPQGYEFRADLPGVKESDLDVTITGNRLAVSGKREMEEQRNTDTYYAMERSYGSFTRTFTLPEDVDTDHIRSELSNGVLTLVMPKKPEVQAKRIAVQSGGQGQAKSKA